MHDEAHVGGRLAGVSRATAGGLMLRIIVPATIPHGDSESDVITETFGNRIEWKRVLYKGRNCVWEVE